MQQLCFSKEARFPGNELKLFINEFVSSAAENIKYFIVLHHFITSLSILFPIHRLEKKFLRLKT